MQLVRHLEQVIDIATAALVKLSSRSRVQEQERNVTGVILASAESLTMDSSQGEGSSTTFTKSA